MAYRSSSFNVSPWQQRSQSFAMGNYQSYNSYGGYTWSDNYSMSQMGRMAYDAPFRYGNDRSGRNQMSSPRRKPMHGKRLPQRSPASGPPSKRPNFGEKSKRRNEQRKRFSRSRKNFRRQPREETASDFEEYEILKTIDDDDVEIKKEESEQNEETMEVNGIGEKKENEGEEKKDEAKKEGDEKKEVKKFTACHVCKVATKQQELMDEHMKTEEHKAKIEAALGVYREKKNAESEKDKEKAQKKARSDNWCTVCEMAFSGHFLSHRSTSEHRRIRDKKYPKCRPCSAGFGSPEEFSDHMKSESHKQKSAEFYHFRKLPIGYDADDAALEPIKIEDETKEEEVKVKVEPKDEAMETDAAEEKKPEDASKAEGDNEKESADKKDKKEEETKKSEEKKPKKPSPIGVSFVVEVDGFFCKLCRKFFKDGSVAKKKHCYSVMHYEAYKNAMEAALKDEEERQRVAEVAAKAEAEAAEAAKLAAEIAAVQREARTAARKAASEKRAAQKSEQPKEELKDEGIEMSPADEQDKPAEAKQEPKDETSLPEHKEQTEEMCT